MNFSTYIKIFFLIISIPIFAQQKNSIIGKVTSDNKAIVDAAIELQINKVSKFSISNKDGNYKFPDLFFVDTDSLCIKVNYLGYKPFIQKVKYEQNIVVNIDLIVKDPLLLDEVVINDNKKTNITARKSSYKVNQKDFIKNAKAGEVLNTVPNLYYNQGTAIVDGKLESKIFIDGVETTQNEIQTIDASDIDRVEVMNNPSAAYGTDFLGAVINIITKKKTEEFIKGSIGLTEGFVNKYHTVSPIFSYKRGVFTIKLNYRYLENNSQVNYSSSRIDENGTFYSSNISNSVGTQPIFQSRIKIDLSEKSNISFSNQINGYKFISNATGASSLNNTGFDAFSKNGENQNKQWNIASVYTYKVSDNKSIFVKSAYAEYEKKDINTFNYSNLTSNYYNVLSKNKEFTANISYEAEELIVFKKPSAFYTDLKYISRDYSFSNTNFYINQNIFNGTAELDTEWTEKFSTETTLTIEKTTNSNTITRQDYSLILPTINALYHFKNKYDAKFGYSRKVLRPSVGDLNDAIVIIYPGVAKQGNSNLDPQIRNYYSFTVSKAFKSDNISLKLYNESINNSIEEVYKTDGNLIVQTLGNAAKFNSTGMTFGLRTKLFKKVSANLNSGFEYNVFEDNSTSAIIKKNSGYTFIGNINLSTKLFKDKVAISFSGRQNGPEYSLLSKRINKPYLDLTISTNLFKDKLNLSLYGKGLLGNTANGFVDISNYNNFYQKIEAKNNSSNILLTLTYNFGKKFNDKIEDNNIENNDVRR
jgi:hypothetical protein